MSHAEMDLRQKCHRWILHIDKNYQAFESIHMNEYSGLVTMRWKDKYGKIQTTQTTYGQMK